MLDLHFPDRTVRNSKKAIAFMLTPEGIKIHYIKIIYTKFFLVKNHGIFEVEQTKGIRYGKTTVYFFDTRSAKPIDLQVMKELSDFAYKNKLHRIKRKDVRHGDQLRQLLGKGKSTVEAITEFKDVVIKKRGRINNIIEELQKTQNASVEPIPEKDQGLVLVDALIRTRLIDKEDAEELKDNLIGNKITIVDLVEKLRDMEKIDIQTPISVNAHRFLDDYHTYSPAEVDVFIDRAERLGSKMTKMGSPEVKNHMQAGLVFAIIVGGAIALMVLGSSDLGNFLPSFDASNPAQSIGILPEQVKEPPVEETPIDDTETVSPEDEELIEGTEVETVIPPEVSPVVP